MLYDDTIIIRMFEYGYFSSKEQIKEDLEEIVIEFPIQKIIFLEENSRAKDTINMRIVLPNDTSLVYEVPVMRYWEYDIKALTEKNLGALLPLQIFKLRKSLENISSSKKTAELKEKMIYEKYSELKQIIIDISHEINDLKKLHKITSSDFEMLESAIMDLSNYLYEKYMNYDKVKKEVETIMTNYFSQEAIAERITRKTAASILIDLLMKKFNSLPSYYEDKIDTLDEKEIKEIIVSIFEIENLDDLEHWFN